MLPDYSVPVLLSGVFVMMLVYSWKFPKCTTFDISFVFLAVCVTAVLQTFFFYGVTSQLGTQQGLEAVQSIVQLDPSNQLKERLRCEVTIDDTQFSQKAKALDKNNLNRLMAGGPGIFIYTSGAIGIVSAVLFVLRNIKKGIAPITAGHLFSLLLLPVPFVIQLLVHYLVFNKEVFVQKSDAVAHCLDKLKSVVGRDLIGLWNSDDALRSNIDKKKDVADQVKETSTELDTVKQEIDAMGPSLDQLTADKKAEVSALLDACRKFITDTKAQLTSLSASPCAAAGDSTTTSKGSKVPAVLNLSKSLTKISEYSKDGNSGRVDVDIALQNFVDSTLSVVKQIHRLSVSEHCNKRERVRLLLHKLQSICKGPEKDDLPFFIKRCLSNFNGIIILLLTVLSIGVVFMDMTKHRMWCEALNVFAICSLCLFFFAVFSNHLYAGKFETPMTTSDKQLMLYMISTNTKDYRKHNKLSPKSDICS